MLACYFFAGFSNDYVITTDGSIFGVPLNIGTQIQYFNFCGASDRYRDKARISTLSISVCCDHVVSRSGQWAALRGSWVVLDCLLASIHFYGNWCFPKRMQTSNGTKEGDKNKLKNYRLISRLPVYSKLIDIYHANYLRMLPCATILLSILKFWFRNCRSANFWTLRNK